MSEILIKAASLIAIIGIGYGIKRLGWVTTGHFGIFSAIVLKVTLPAALITSFNDFEITTSLLLLSGIGLAINAVQQLSGYLIERKHGHRAQAFAVLNVGSYNMGAFATPYLAGILGPQAVVHSSMFDVGNAVQAAGFGFGWSKSLADPTARVNPLSFLRLMFSSVVFDVYLGLLVLGLLRLRLPDPIITFTSTVGAANTFLAMLMIGIGLEIRLRPEKYLAAARYLAVRYFWSAAFAVACWFLVPFDQNVRTVLCLSLFAPIASMTPGLTSEIDGDVELSTFMTSATILVALIVMPVLAAGLGA